MRARFLRHPSRGAAAILLACVVLTGCTTAPAYPRFSLPRDYDGEVYAVSTFVRAPIQVSARTDWHELRTWVRQGEQVTGEVEYIVDESGRVIAGHIIETNNTAYATALLVKISETTFIPGSREGKPVKVRVRRLIRATQGTPAALR